MLINLKLTPGSNAQQFVTYHVQDGDTILYVGSTTFANAINFVNVRKFTGFDSNKTYTIGIHGFYTRKSDATRDAYRISKQLSPDRLPEWNREDIGMRNRPVKCIVTGQEFTNASEAAMALNVDTGRMSYHLNRRQGYKSIKGRVLEYV